MPELDASIPDLLQAGLEHHQAGRLGEARDLYEQVLRIQPDNPDALSLLGLVVAAQGNVQHGIRLVQHALTVVPRSPEALNYLTALLLSSRRPDEALAAADAAIALRPDFAEAYINRGLALDGLDRHEEALTSYDTAIALRPDYALTFFNRGNVLLKLACNEMALTSYDTAIALQPDYAEAHSNRSLALDRLGRSEEALASADAAIELRPDLAEAFSNRSLALHNLIRDEEALASADRAIALRPDLPEAFTNRGNALLCLDRPEEALASLDQAIALRPDYAGAFNNRGAVLSSLDRVEAALASYEQALALSPDDAASHFGTALCLLQLGDFARGWAEHEWRWKVSRIQGRAPGSFREPPWLGAEPLAGRRILLHAEQGLGDTLQFCRYVPLVAGLGARIVLEVPRPLMRLLASLAGEAELVASGDPLPPFDVHCPLMSLPLALGTTLATIPATVPYLAADPLRAAAWRQRLAALPGRVVGLVWAGAPRRHHPDAHAIDRRRSMRLDHLAPLAAIPGVSFVSLQKGDAAAQSRSPPPGLQLHDVTAELNDFADTAALVAALDLVITVDTAVAHLAGALAKPVWIINRFDAAWRWLRGREDSPWYPTARLFRQPAPGDWGGAVGQVRASLAALVRDG